METHDTLLPDCVMVFKLCCIALNDFLIKSIILFMLLSIPFQVFFFIVNKQFIDLWLEEESNRDQIFTQLAEEATRSLALEVS